MKTLLVRPFVDSTIGISPPLSLMYLSAYLKVKGQAVEIIDKVIDRTTIKDFSLQDPNIRELFSDIHDYNPDIIGMTLFSRELVEIARLCKLIKREFKSALIVLGGPHPTAMPAEILERIPDCDIAVRGEGEVSLYNLISVLSSNRSLREVKGILFRTNNGEQIYHCEDAEAISELDSLPFPDRKGLIHNYRNGNYASFLYGNPCDILITSRGCPFQCSFCFKVYKKYRSRSPENVLEEIDWIVSNVAPKYIQIMDDSFTINRNRAMSILNGLIERKYPVKFKVRSRVSAVDEEMLKKMKQAGVDTIVYGFESGSQRMLNAFNKRTTLEENVTASKLTRKAGLSCLGDMILFYPGENRQTLKETERFIKKAKPTAVKFYILTPLPQTKVYKEAKENGSLVGNWDIGGDTPWIKLDDFSGVEEMQQIAKRMFIKTLLNPSRVFWILKVYGKSFIANPSLALKMILHSFRKRNKY